MTQEPEAPTIAVARRQRVDALAVPHERLVVLAALVDAAVLPVRRGGCRSVVVTVVVLGPAVLAVRSIRCAARLARIGAGGAEADTEQTGDSDTCG